MAAKNPGMMRLLLIVLALSLLSPLLVVASSSSSLQVLVTRSSPQFLHFTCFHTDATVETCCQGIRKASAALPNNKPLRNLDDCQSQIAEVPKILATPTNLTLARYSWMLLSYETKEEEEDSQPQQYLWKDDELQERSTHLPPYLLTDHEPTISTTRSNNNLSIRSQLSPHGGMHRLWQHTIDHTDIIGLTDKDATRILVFLTIPQGMFVDLDDPLEGLKDYELHAAAICDIEQPAFVSGQHVLVVEIVVPISMSTAASFATKLHLRYPQPSETYEQWIDLPTPIVVALSEDGSLLMAHHHHTIIFDDTSSSSEVERVWVAAGSDDDHDGVQWTTMLAAFAGVLWMLLDISYVSQWEE
jgi:hypothetical protein